ncbi:MAG: MATE family efflux transporter [Solirubrobacterales bacterium]
MDKSKELEIESIGKLLLKFAIPAVVGMLVNALYSVVDRIFVGRGVGSLALSGVAVTFPITNVIMAVGMLVGIGSAALVSIKLGQKKREEAEVIVGNAFVLTILFSLFLTILGILFLDPILNALGATSETLPYAKRFASLLLTGTVLQNVGFGLNPIIRAEGDPKTAMITMLIGALMNFIINPVLIFGLKLGVAGSAYATLISQSVCSVWILLYFTKGKSLLKLKKKNMKLKIKVIEEIISIGVSPFAMQIAASLVAVVMNTSLLKYGGDLAIGAFSLINSIAILIVMPMIGINQGAQPIIGFNYGAKNESRVKKALFYSAGVNVFIAVLGFIAVQLFPVQIMHMFNTSDQELITMGANGISIFLLMIAFVGPQTSCVNYFQSVGKAKHSMFLSLLRQVVILIPLALILPRFFKLNGVWMAGPASDFISSVIAYMFIFKEIKLLNRWKEETELMF